MGWYAVRNIYHFGTKRNGKNIFEERIVGFEAADFEEAHAKGAEESDCYAKSNGFDVYSEQDVYKQDGTPLIDGYELWSCLYESDKTLEVFYKDFYERYEYDPTVE